MPQIASHPEAQRVGMRAPCGDELTAVDEPRDQWVADVEVGKRVGCDLRFVWHRREIRAAPVIQGRSARSVLSSTDVDRPRDAIHTRADARLLVVALGHVTCAAFCWGFARCGMTGEEILASMLDSLWERA